MILYRYMHFPFLVLQAEYDGNMPMYFRFLTVMAFHVFVKEKVSDYSSPPNTPPL